MLASQWRGSLILVLGPALKLNPTSRGMALGSSPPKEPGPEDCCQSGCINCVWEIYAAELAAWKVASANAPAGTGASAAAGAGQQAPSSTVGQQPTAPVNLASVSMSAFQELEASLASQTSSKGSAE